MQRRIALALGLFAMVIAAPAFAGKADDTLRVAWGAEGPLESVDYYFGTKRTGAEIASLVWDTLVWRDPEDFSYRPLLAKAWRQVNDTTLEFDLRDDVAFQDGSRFTADDVVATLNTVSAPSFKARVQRNVNWIAAAVQTGTYRVRIISKVPFPPALDYIASSLPIYPAEYYAAAGPEGMHKHPIGTGPYRMVSVETAIAYRLARNDTYFKGGPKGDHFIKVGGEYNRVHPAPRLLRRCLASAWRRRRRCASSIWGWTPRGVPGSRQWGTPMCAMRSPMR